MTLGGRRKPTGVLCLKFIYRLRACYVLITVSCTAINTFVSLGGRLRLQCDGTRAETRFPLSAKRTSPFKSAGVWASVQSTTGRRAVHISLQCFYCSCKPVFCSHVTLTGYTLHSLVSPSLLLPCVTVCYHISNSVYKRLR
jgi:hypothetical protein